MRAPRTAAALSAVTGVGVLLQWILVWSGAFPINESVPGFRNYFVSFVAADMWLVIAGLCAARLITKGDRRASLAATALGSAMMFFGLYALLYDFNTGLLFRMSADELFGKSVTFYNILVGAVLMTLAWMGADNTDAVQQVRQADAHEVD